MQLLDLKNLDVENIDLPKCKYNAFVICDETVKSAALLDKLIGGSAKEINFYGKWSMIWQDLAEEILDEYIRARLRDNDNKCTLDTPKDLGNFVRWLRICQRESLPTILIYDNEKLKNFVIKRANESDKEFNTKHRVELYAHTNRTKNLGISSASKMIETAFNDIEEDGKELDGLAITDFNATNAFYEAQRTFKNYNKDKLKLLYGCEVSVEKNHAVTVICKNNEGKKALYKILTTIFTNKEENKNWYDLIDENRKDLLIGSGTDPDFILGKIRNNTQSASSFFDFVEVAPLNRYGFSPVINKEALQESIKAIIAEANKLNKPVVATSIPYYATSNDYLEFSILYEHDNKDNKLPDKKAFHILSTEEMLYEFDWLNDAELVKDIVINNTHKIADMCENFEPFNNNYQAPVIADAYEKVRQRSYDKFHEIYGNNEDSYIRERLEKELKIIKDYNYASIFYITSEICRIAKQEGYRTGYRGLVGSSLVAFFLGITECNPLPAHTVCNRCHKIVWCSAQDGEDCFIEECSCGGKQSAYGHNLHYEMLFGLDGEKVPDFDLNLDPEFAKTIPDILKEIAPHNTVIKAGTLVTRSDAQEIVNDFAGEGEEVLTYEIKDDMVNMLGDVAAKQSIYKAGYIITPDYVDINDYTPINEVEGELCTHYEYHDIFYNFYKLDCLEHVDMQSFNILESNGINIDEIDISNLELNQFLFGGHKFKGCSLLGIPEFDNELSLELIDKLGAYSFEDVVKISSLAHGTRVWRNNQDSLCAHGMKIGNVVASRDDVLDFLLEYDVPFKDAYEIMEYVRKGKAAAFGFTDKQLSIMKDHNVPSTFIDVCKKIYYMFPRAHSIAYVTNALRLAWIKLYKPAYFYADYFALRAKEIDVDIICKSAQEIHKEIINLIDSGDGDGEYIKTLEIAEEMNMRGIKITNIDASNSDAVIGFDVSKDDENEIICYKANV